MPQPSVEPPNRWSAAGSAELWVSPAEDPRTSDAPLTDERSTLLDYLSAYRATLEMKCADLDPEQMARRSVPPSTMSLLGLVRHLADVERHWFRNVMAGENAPKLYGSEEIRHAAWLDAVADPTQVEQAWEHWRAEVDFASAYVDRVSDLAVTGTMKNGESLQLREVLVHMIEEYARHCGHADLLRECIDGRVGH
ncbi:MAG: DinB family protein [Frankiaceae bacterium]|nr:DinB family protein [Frankiaceae bacterium]MBV9870725.1 DinB family protein [Frankiaceae bacterium]